jgi:hypothetical protein
LGIWIISCPKDKVRRGLFTEQAGLFTAFEIFQNNFTKYPESSIFLTPKSTFPEEMKT